jgi:hypothetical protein
MLGRHGSIVIPQNTPYAEEMRKHEAFPTEFGPGKRPYVYREFPKMLYKAVRKVDDAGKSLGISYDNFTVNDEHEQRNMQSRGYATSQQDALADLEHEQTEHGKLAAERNFEIKHGRISEKAASEVRAAEAEHGARHLPVVAETPIKRRGRKPKSESVPA